MEIDKNGNSDSDSNVNTNGKGNKKNGRNSMTF